jgi:hypothetical protein
VLSRAFLGLTDWLDRRFGWDRLPRLIGIVTLIGVRNRLRERNLEDTGLRPADAHLTERAADPAHTSRRTRDGTLNTSSTAHGRRRHALRSKRASQVDLSRAGGCAARPQPPDRQPGADDAGALLPATTLNVLAATWIQFEVHDWFSHGTNEEEHSWELELADDDDWPHRPMVIPRTRRDPTSDEDPETPPTYVTADSHWWDGSQIYGSKEGFAEAIRAREDGKLRSGRTGFPRRTSNASSTSVVWTRPSSPT